MIRLLDWFRHCKKVPRLHLDWTTTTSFPILSNSPSINILPQPHSLTDSAVTSIRNQPLVCSQNTTSKMMIIIIFIYCSWVVTRWQWLLYMYTKYEIGSKYEISTKYEIGFSIYFCKTLYMFQTRFPSIIRSSKLQIQCQTNTATCC